VSREAPLSLFRRLNSGSTKSYRNQTSLCFGNPHCGETHGQKVLPSILLAQLGSGERRRFDLETLQGLPGSYFVADPHPTCAVQASAEMGQDVGLVGPADVSIRREEGRGKGDRGGEAEVGEGEVVKSDCS
jgi:hypothetical protein